MSRSRATETRRHRGLNTRAKPGDRSRMWRLLLEAWRKGPACQFEFAARCTRVFPDVAERWMVLADGLAGTARYREARIALQKAGRLTPRDRRWFLAVQWGHLYRSTAKNTMSNSPDEAYYNLASRRRLASGGPEGPPLRSQRYELARGERRRGEMSRLRLRLRRASLRGLSAVARRCVGGSDIAPSRCERGSRQGRPEGRPLRRSSKEERLKLRGNEFRDFFDEVMRARQ
jgi:hypothetical protein